MTAKAPLAARLILKNKLDWSRLTTADEVIAAREQIHRRRNSPLAPLITGRPEDGVTIEDHPLDLPGRRIRVRVHRPAGVHTRLPLILSFHGGGFVLGTPEQNDWLNSHLALHTPAVVVSVDYRLSPEHPLPAPVDDARDTLARLLDDPARWGFDPDAVAVFGESAGGTLAALVASHSTVRAQVLAYPATDWSESMTDYPSMTANTGNPGLSPSDLEGYRRWSLPATVDPRSVSPIRLDNHTGLPPALIITAGLDPLADQGRRYAERLQAGNTGARLIEYPKAVHGFLSAPGVIPAARPARTEILKFLRSHLGM